MALLAASLLGLALTACSQGTPPAQLAFEPTRAAEHQATDLQLALAVAKERCTSEARKKGISSVTRILGMQDRTFEADYVACMEAKGFAAAQN